MGGVQGASRALCGAALVLAFAQAAVAEIYAWRTEDGGYAYTDDRDQIPARYREQAQALKRRSLESYERFTPQDAASAEDYAERLERRLQSLREANARSAVASTAAQPQAAPTGNLLVSTGGDNAPQIEVPMSASSSAPVVVEPHLSKRSGDFRTRRTTVVRQGDRTIAILKGPPHNFDPVNGILDEDELEAGER
jgi:hypothetical protein